MHGLQLAFCAGVTEEIVFRGYLINYFTRLLSGQPLHEAVSPGISGGVIAAIVLTSLIFGLSHLYLGWSDTIKVAVLAIILGFIFTLSGSLVIVIVLHVMIDVAANLASFWITSIPDSETTLESSDDNPVQ
jgi:membrane protease YdiL (CAAX protease family)